MSHALRALVIERDPDVRDLVVMSLDVEGIEVCSVATGAAAIQVARELDPDMVTLDLALPDMDGIDLCRRLREVSDAYIIIITGRDEEVVRLRGLEVGADDYLSKPFSPRELRTKAAARLRRPRPSRS